MQLTPLQAAPAAHLPIYRLEAQVLQQAQVEMPVEHHHCEGLYARTMRIPAGTVATGAVHRHECFFVLREGEMHVTTDGGVRHMKAGEMLTTPAGSKRAVVTLADCVVTTFHANPSGVTDPQAIWELFTIPPPQSALANNAAEALA